MRKAPNTFSANYHIRKILAEAEKPLNSHQIIARLSKVWATSEGNARQILGQQVYKGQVKAIGREACECCGSKYTVYELAKGQAVEMGSGYRESNGI